MTTIKDIARISGYSIGTVSRVINNHPDVSEAARKKIQEVIEEENYQPNVNAKKMKQKSSNVVGIMIQGTSNTFFSELLESVQKNLELAGQESVIHYMDENADEIQEALALTYEVKPQGILFLGGSLDGYDEALAQYNVPTVLITNTAKNIQSEAVSSFTVDNYLAGQSAAKYLYNNGHRKIGIIGGNRKTTIALDRIHGAIDAMKENDLDFAPDYYEESRFSLAGGYTATKNLLERHPDITAIFALSDTIAVGCLRCLHDMGYTVPDDMSIIGFDGIEFGQYSVPRLTTINQDVELLAKKAIEDLLFRVHFNRPGVHEIVPFQIIKGATVSQRHS